LPLLVLVLLGVLAWTWATDHPTPADPQGRIPPALRFFFLAIALGGAAAVAWSEVQRRLRARADRSGWPSPSDTDELV